VIGAGRVLERREHDPVADRLERAPRRAVVGFERPRMGGRVGPGEERLEVAVRLAAGPDPGGDLGAAEGAPALRGGPDVEDGVGPEPGDPDVREIPLAPHEQDVAGLQ
jgi:hypothetical protein